MMKSKTGLFLAFTVAALLASCVTPKDTNYLQDIKKNYPTDDVAPVDYQIIVGDQLQMSIYTSSEETLKLFSIYTAHNIHSNNTGMNIGGGGGGGSWGTAADLPANVLNVYANGAVTIPHIGQVEVQGLTINEAKKTISDKFKLLYPDVSVDISLRNRYFFVLGEAGAKAIPMNSMRMNIFQAMAQAGNVISLYGDRKNVKLVRQTASGTEVKTFDLRTKDILNSDYYYIQPNDVIYVQQMQRRFWGSITSFSSIFGFITGALGMILLVINLVNR
ncbi:MAG: polysaccharide biosynthesis/export family protein [Prevotella sp.]|jgi:polysaccharide export outer membrane protein|nr:polysaccharide biosynthesis/export family protein [Prevotella sp.]